MNNFFDILKRFFSPPIFEGDEEKTRAAELVNTMLISQLALFVFALITYIVSGGHAPVEQVIGGLLFIVFLFGLLWPLRRGYVMGTGITLLVLLTLLTGLSLASGGTIRQPIISMFLLASIFAGLAMGRRAAILNIVVDILIVAGVAYGEWNHLLPPPEATTTPQLVVIFAIAGVLTIVLLNQALHRIETSLELANARQKELTALNIGLEQRVTERTEALSSVAEVATVASATLETDKLLQQVVDLAKERFNFYHAHIYLLNEAGDTLVLASGAGEPGRQMVAEGRSIALDREQSLVARAAREKKGVTVNDVTQEPDFLPNLLLPETHAELAVPMIVGEQVIGVFDVQSELVGRFTDADIAVQTTLASQVASAIQNARSFERAEESIKQLNAQRYALDQHSIVAITDVSGKITYANDKFVEISKYSREELIGQDHRILNSGYHPKEFIRNLWVTIANGKVFHAEIKNKAKDGSLYWVDTTIVPFLNEEGKPIQYLAIRTDITRRKNDEEALAKRARQQEALNAITQKIQGATTIEAALQVTARELGLAFGRKQTVVTLDLNDNNSDHHEQE